MKKYKKELPKSYYRLMSKLFSRSTLLPIVEKNDFTRINEIIRELEKINPILTHAS